MADETEPLIRGASGAGQGLNRWLTGQQHTWLTGIVVAALVLVGGHDLLKNGAGSSAEDWGNARPLEKLKQPLVILISLDGFRWGYQQKVSTPNIDSLMAEGTAAAKGLIPVYPTATFPNHYSIATGLYPAWHGIIQNEFRDPVTRKKFKRGDNSPEWWLGEPLWVTVTKLGKVAAASFWPGCEVELPPWTCPPQFCPAYNKSVGEVQRINQALEWVDLPDEQRPSFMSLYFNSPDAEGHTVGPDGPQLSAALQRVDSLLGLLIDGLKARGVYDDVSLILLGDHGMVQTCEGKHIYVEDFKPWINIPAEWVEYSGTQLTIRPPENVSAVDVHAGMLDALSTGKIQNGEHLKVYLREDLPPRLHYSSGRVQPIIGLVDESYNVAYDRSGTWCGGVHGYDNALMSMRSIFIARGPQFARGRLVPSFENVQVYNVIANILSLQNAAPNNGSLSFKNSLLLSP
ncbi:hypothetical protein MPTK1_5g15020 [Marchantia polymorpha subsp. ruderalis]|uniref:Uncharacterized protein n=2 Tax=Marchantia polymorpha TaxID=3197 RepID=A0AAF6BII3_MARPO|nr:hypothetical protein MARPO_0071s0108 [Marchantia polymorpha]BBN11817.1 hypothetical protein Mp_5g15020 [Marchantia polymorpha subsp. ruderalis]|eukprot:PTQ35505.1 hypothetical protein MARPO_0071s0108 [Marchantia polymorpha]